MSVRDFSEATSDQKVSIVAKALEWLCMAQALTAMHDKGYAARRLIDEGCPVRFDDRGEVVVFHNKEWWYLKP